MRLSDKKKNRCKELIFVYSILAIPLIAFAIFYVYCNFQSFLMAFQLRDINGETYWTLQNFIDIFNDIKSGDQGELVLATKNTLTFFLLGQVMFPISFITSYFLYKKIPLHGAYRLLLFVPSILSSVVWANIYINLLSVTGPVAQLWQWITNSPEPPTFLTDNRYAMPAVMGYSIWFGITSNFVLYSGTLTRIPKELEEAGMLEGITWFQELRSVVIPMVWPTISTVWLMGLMGIFTASGAILLLTNGAYDTMTLSHFLFTRVYQQPETSNLYNYSAAIGIVLTVLTLPVVFVVRWLLEKVEPVEY